MSTRSEVQFVRIEPAQHGQRVDNFLFRYLKGIPHSRIYRLIRRGEVRINKKRCRPDSRLDVGDLIRIPPHEPAQTDTPPKPGAGLRDLIRRSVLYEDANLLIINKPAGVAVHGGSGIHLGLIEAVRQVNAGWQHAELVHRLDRNTSGCLLLCKTLDALRDLQAQLKNRTVQKDYLALVFGQWPEDLLQVSASLKKITLSSGEQLVRVDAAGKKSLTRFRVRKRFQHATLVLAAPDTGRTHQIRVHCQSAGHSIMGDAKYRAGYEKAPKSLTRIRHLCLHAQHISFQNPANGSTVMADAPLEKRFAELLDSINL